MASLFTIHGLKTTPRSDQFSLYLSSYSIQVQGGLILFALITYDADQDLIGHTADHLPLLLDPARFCAYLIGAGR